jgi:hypothetical protein
MPFRSAGTPKEMAALFRTANCIHLATILPVEQHYLVDLVAARVVAALAHAFVCEDVRRLPPGRFLRSDRS